MSRFSPRNLSLLASAALLWAVALPGCDVTPLGDETGGEDIPQSVQDAFANSCATSGCHAGASPVAGLSLEAAQLGALVGGSTGNSDLPLVEIGNVHGSYLALKMLPDSARPESAGAVVGSQMPPGTANPTDTAIILAWIAGADVDGAGGEGGEGGEEAPCYGPTETPTSVAYADHIHPIMEATCASAGCHDSQSMTGLALPADAAGALAAMVGVDSSAGMPYVTADSPDNSYLWHKVAGTYLDVDGGQGLLMPLGTNKLCQSDLLLLNKWILQGAN